MSTFHLFSSFPLEVQGLILNSCPTNDKMCLSLANKTLYSLADKSDHSISLSNTDEEGHLCGTSSPASWQPSWSFRYQHRQTCHSLSWKESNVQRLIQGLPEKPLKKCRSRNYSYDHCYCFTRKYRLYNRLRGWITRGLGRGWGYCGVCDRFTRRKPGHGGRCYHGKPKQRRYEGNYWTHRSRRGAFGRKLWKKWFNNNALNGLESRLREGNSQRDGLRNLEKRDVDTRRERGVYC